MEPIHPCAKQEGNAFCREIVEDNVRTIDLGRDNAALVQVFPDLSV